MWWQLLADWRKEETNAADQWFGELPWISEELHRITSLTHVLIWTIGKRFLSSFCYLPVAEFAICKEKVCTAIAERNQTEWYHTSLYWCLKKIWCLSSYTILGSLVLLNSHHDIIFVGSSESCWNMYTLLSVFITATLHHHCSASQSIGTNWLIDRWQCLELMNWLWYLYTDHRAVSSVLVCNE